MISKIESLESNKIDTPDTTFDFDTRISPMDKSHNMENDSLGFNADKRIDKGENFENPFSLEECLRFFDEDIFSSLSIEEKAFVCDLLCDAMAEKLGIYDKPVVGFFEDQNRGNCGGYNAEANVIGINVYNIDDGDSIKDTIIHEMRHCWQHIRASLPLEYQNDEDLIFKQNFENYINPEDNYRAYLSQPVEIDARAFAEAFR